MMTQALRVIITILFFSQSFQVRAQDDVDCENAVSNMQLKQCTFGAYLKANDALNDVYGKFLILAGVHAPKLQKAQKDWIKVRKSYCNYVLDSILPGQEAPIDANVCLESLTWARAVEFIKIIQQKDPSLMTADLKEIMNINGGEFEMGESIPYDLVRKYWDDYIKSSCDFYSKFTNEEYKLCTKRLSAVAAARAPDSYNNYMKSDAALNTVYRKLITVLGEFAPEFQQIQRKWIKVKENHCNYLYYAIDSQDKRININECLQSMTQERTREIIRMINMKGSVPEGIKNFVSEFSEGETKVVYQKNTYETLQKYWDSYFKATCEFSAKYVQEDYSLCIERISKPLLRSPG